MDNSTSVPTKVIGTQDKDINYEERQAVRAIVYNEATQEIAVVHIKKGGYYKLPGGGIEDEEDHKIAVNREILEETGCTIDTNSAYLLATSEEWRNDLHQISYCYVAKLADSTGKPELTELEASEGLTHRWISVDFLIVTMNLTAPKSDLGKFVQERDLFFLEAYKDKVALEKPVASSAERISPSTSPLGRYVTSVDDI